MILIKPIVQEILLKEADETPTWGEVKQAFQIIISAQDKQDAISGLKKLGKVGVSMVPGIGFLTKAVEAVNAISDMIDMATAMLSLGKAISNSELKNPKGSEFKNLTAPFWDAVRLDPEVSIILDDKIEKQFIDQIILPKLKDPGNENEKIPNMNYELGKWLNKQGLKDADIFFKGKSEDLT